jgi:uncharacterized protein (DUF305 family)
MTAGARAAALVLAAALSLGSLGCSRTSESPEEASVDAGFARDMAAHHAQAVEMAEIIRVTTADDAVRALATDIVLTQQAQIGRMHGWLEVWGLRPSSTLPRMAWMDHEGLMPGMASRTELETLRAATGVAADQRFLKLMIEHHRGGVDMAGVAAAKASRPEVRRLARAIVASQESDIRAMEEMLGVSAAADEQQDTAPEQRPGDHGEPERPGRRQVLHGAPSRFGPSAMTDRS